MANILCCEDLVINEKPHKNNIYGNIKSSDDNLFKTAYTHMSAIYIHNNNLFVKLRFEPSSVFSLAIQQTIQNIYKSLSCVEQDVSDEITVRINDNANIKLLPSVKSGHKEFTILHNNSEATKHIIVKTFPALKYKNNIFKVVLKCSLNFNYTVTAENIVFLNMNTSDAQIKYEKTPLQEDSD
jgi:hypothetical protein